MFFANFNLGQKTQLGRGLAASPTDFKDRNVFGRAYVLEKFKIEVGVDYVIELGGGVTEGTPRAEYQHAGRISFRRSSQSFSGRRMSGS